MENGPKENTKSHDELSGVPVTEIAKDGSKNHVRDNKHGLKSSSRGIANFEIILDFT